MKKLSILIFACLILSSSIVSAQEQELRPVQTLTMLGGRIELIKDKLSWLGNMQLLYTPEENDVDVYAYTGLEWNATSWLWLSPQVGYAGRVRESEKDSFLFSLSTGVDTQYFYLLLQGDGYLTGSQLDFFSYARADIVVDPWYIGVQSESFNDDWIFGVHTGFVSRYNKSMRRRNLSIEFQYFVDLFKEEPEDSDKIGHIFKFVFILNVF